MMGDDGSSELWGGPRRHLGAFGHVDSALRQLQLQLANFITSQLRYPLLFCISRLQLLELSTIMS